MVRIQGRMGRARAAAASRMIRQPVMRSAAEVDSERAAYVRAAQAIIRVRDLRDRMIGGHGQFADPAWDLLLDLYVATVEDRPLAVGDACVGARVPQTTALRWIDQLERLGKVKRTADPSDRRRTLVSLTDTQLSLMDRFFRSAADAVGSVGGDNANFSSSNPNGR